MGLYTITHTDLFNASAEILGVGYYYMTLGFTFIGSRLGTCGAWLLAPSLTTLDDLVSLFSTLTKTHLGDLQLVSALLRFSISFWRSSVRIATNSFGPKGESTNYTVFG